MQKNKLLEVSPSEIINFFSERLQNSSHEGHIYMSISLNTKPETLKSESSYTLSPGLVRVPGWKISFRNMASLLVFLRQKIFILAMDLRSKVPKDWCQRLRWVEKKMSEEVKLPKNQLGSFWCWSLRIGPMTLPQDPGEASLKGQVSIKNTKGEPVACVALDIQAPWLWKVEGGMIFLNRNHRWEGWDPGKKTC